MRSGLVYLTVQPTQVELLSRGVAQKPGLVDVIPGKWRDPQNHISHRYGGFLSHRGTLVIIHFNGILTL